VLAKEQLAAGGARMPAQALCWRHLQRLELSLGYCWRCLAEERDPAYFVTSPSRWWSVGGGEDEEEGQCS
jgi:hypothetical protein